MLGAGAAAAVVSGAAAPEFTITDTAGRRCRLADYQGKYVVLEWTNPECPFVRKHYSSGNMQGLQKEWGARRRVAHDQLDQRIALRIQGAGEMASWMQAPGGAPRCHAARLHQRHRACL